MSAHSDAATLSSSRSDTGASLLSDIAPAFAPPPLAGQDRAWAAWVGPVFSILILGAVVYQLRTVDYRALLALMPSTPLFWLAFAVYYFAGPFSEWVIFRRLWALPVRGVSALLRKLVSNELLLGYLGELYFYAWVRRNAEISASPFGAIKDVAVLSAATGNAFTLMLLVAAAPFFDLLGASVRTSALAASLIVVFGSSIAMLALRGRLFTLPPAELRFIALMHGARILAMALLAACMWHMILPTVALGWWLLLGTVRQLLSRLPFVPNKDVVFAGVAALLAGQDREIVAAMALMASLIVAAHVVVGALLGAAELARQGDRA
ncbi:hypothetical protein [Sphingomonas sp. AP4-R1]|uniref:hypothetical protein n=1 Tax=Sphingomonas sp. AP4-R1 TaxID=2735134 RepID=UPI001C10B490|nr:hypothetical protein [Sphingomonas sp. AP4-R1]